MPFPLVLMVEQLISAPPQGGKYVSEAQALLQPFASLGNS